MASCKRTNISKPEFICPRRMFTRLQELDRVATDRGLDALALLEKEPELLRQWLHFQKELLNRSADLGFDTSKFLKKGGSSSSSSNNDKGAGNKEEPTIDWFELSLSLTYQLRFQRSGESASAFPAPLPRKFVEMWPRKKVTMITDEYAKIADSNVYSDLLIGMRKSAVRWCFTIDALLSELEEGRLCAWKLICEDDKLHEPGLNKRGILQEELKDAIRCIIGTNTDDAPLIQAIEATTERLRNERHAAPTSEPASPTTIRLSSESKKTLQKLNGLLRVDYRTRRELTIERLDVTLQSFTWSKRGADIEQQMMEEVQDLRSQLSSEPRQVDLDTILASELEPSPVAHESRLEDGARLRSLVIGPVPDRGGRTNELDEREMQQAKRGQWNATFSHKNNAKKPHRREAAGAVESPQKNSRNNDQAKKSMKRKKKSSNAP